MTVSVGSGARSGAVAPPPCSSLRASPSRASRMANSAYAVPTTANMLSMTTTIRMKLVPRRCGRRCERAIGRNMAAVSGRVR